MSIAKELLKKEEQYAEIQLKLEADMKNILEEYTKYKGQPVISLKTQNIDDSCLHRIESEVSSSHERDHADHSTKNRELQRENSYELNSPTTAAHIITTKFQEQISGLKNELSTMKTAHNKRTEEYNQLKASKDKLTNDIIKLNNQNNTLRNNLRDKEVLFTEKDRKLEIARTEKLNIQKELDKVKNELRSSIASGKIQKDQIDRIKKNYEILQHEVKKLEQINKEEKDAKKLLIKNSTKKIEDQRRLINELVAGLGQQQVFIENLQRQNSLLATFRLNQMCESAFRQLLNLYLPEDNSTR